jgi:hypothetical protein
MDQVFGTGREAAAALYESIVADLAASGQSLPTKDSDPTPDSVETWVQSTISYAKKIEYGHLFQGLLKMAVTAGVGYLVFDAVAAISTEAAVWLGVILVVIVGLASLCFAIVFLIEALKTKWADVQSQFLPG